MAIIDLIMPKMGESIMEATILRWYKKVGDHVQQDETLLDIATDKVDSEVPSSIEGTVSEILYSVNDVVPVGSVIAKIQTSASEVTTASVVTVATPQFVAESASIAEPQPTHNEPVVHHQEIEQTYTQHVEDLPYAPQNVNVSKPAGNNRFFSPLVLNIANSEGLSLSELERIPGTGADGRVSKKDVIQYISDKKSGNQPVFIATQPQVVYASQSAPEPQIVYVPQPVPAYVAPQPTYIAPTIVEQPVAEAVKAAFVAPRTEPILIPEPAAIVESTPAPIQTVDDALSDTDLGELRGGDAIVVGTQTLTATTTGNVINGNYTAGNIAITGNALSNFNGLGNLVINTGAQNSLQSATNVTINIAP